MLSRFQFQAGISSMAFGTGGLTGAAETFVVGGETGAVLHCKLGTHDLLHTTNKVIIIIRLL